MMGTLLSLFGVVPKKIGGQEAYARELSLQLAQHGWHSVLCFDGAPPEAVGKFLSLPNVTLETLKAPDRMSWCTLRRFLAILWRHKPDIVHLYYVGFVSLYPILAKLCGVKRVYFTDQTSHAASHVPSRAPLWKRMSVRLINLPLSGTICVSAYGYRCRTMLDTIPAHRIHMIYNAVDTFRAGQDPENGRAFRRKYEIPEERSIVTQVSWIIPEKGIGDLLEAWRLVLNKDSTAQLVIVGDGAARDDYVRLAARIGIEDHVTWTGVVQDPLGEGVFAAADIVCQVSRWEEVFGFTIAEAMACGKPVIATRVGGIPELVQDGKTGFLVPRGDIGEIADRILMLLASAEMRQQFGNSGRKTAQVMFDLKKNVAQVVGLYGIP